MNIDFDKINQEDFYLKERGDFILIHPRPNKHKWKEEELGLRSLLVRKSDGEIVSSGFPKFMNYGEYYPHKLLIEDAIVNNKPIRFTSKFDGSLIIRSVIGGINDLNIHFRTRENDSLGDFEEPVISLINKKYPKLVDDIFPVFQSTGEGQTISLLFEYISPDNQIIIRYKEPELILLGSMMYRPDNFPYFTRYYNKIFSEYFDVPMVGVFDSSEFNYTTADELNNFIFNSKNLGEGVVTEINFDTDSPILSKMKCDDYLRMHRLRYQTSVESIRKMIYFDKIPTSNQFVAHLMDKGLDYEIASSFKEQAQQEIIRLNILKNEIEWLFQQMRTFKSDAAVDKKGKIMRLKEIVGNSEHTERLFNLGVAILLDRDEEWLGSQFFEIGTASYKNMKKEMGI